MGIGDINIGRLVGELVLNKKNWDGELDDTQKGIVKWGNYTVNFMADWAKRFAAAGAAAFVGITIKTAQFEHQVKRTVGVLGGGYDEIKRKAREMGEDTIFSATEAAEAMYNLASAGMDVKETVSAIGPAMRMAQAINTNLSTSTSLLASTMSQFGLGAEQADRIVDVLTTSTHKSQLTADKLREGLKFAGTAGRAFGQSIEETVTMFAQFANLGHEGGMAGRHMNAAFTELADLSDDAREAFHKLGIDLKDINPHANSFLKIVKTIAESSFKATDAQKIWTRAAANDMTVIIENYRQGKSTMNSMKEALDNSQGSALKASEDMKNLSTDWKEVVSAIESAALAMGDTWQEEVSKVLRETRDIFRELAREVKNNEEGWKEMAKNVGDIIAGIANSARLIAKDLPTIVSFMAKLSTILKATAKYNDIPWISQLIKLGEIGNGLSFLNNPTGYMSNLASRYAGYLPSSGTVSSSGGVGVDSSTGGAPGLAEENRKRERQRQAERERLEGEKKVVQRTDEMQMELHAKGIARIKDMNIAVQETSEQAFATVENRIERLGPFINNTIRSGFGSAGQYINNIISRYVFSGIGRGLSGSLGGGFGGFASAAGLTGGSGLGGLSNLFGSALQMPQFISGPTGGARMPTLGESLFSRPSLFGSRLLGGGLMGFAMGGDAFSTVGGMLGGPAGAMIGSLINRIGSDRAGTDQRNDYQFYTSRVEAARNSVDGVRSMIGDILNQVNSGSINMSNDDVQTLQAQFDELAGYNVLDPNLVHTRRRRGGLAGWAGGRVHDYHFTNINEVSESLHGFDRLYDRLQDTLSEVEGTAQFNELAGSQAFTGSGNSVINNNYFEVGSLIGDDKSLELLANRVGDVLMRLGKIGRGAA